MNTPSNPLPFELSRHEKLLWSYAAASGPTDPTRATIKDGTILILPGLLLLLLGINAWKFAKAFREYREIRRTCAFLLAVDTAAGSFDTIALDYEP